MTFPNFEITTGLQLTADGTDLAVLWPSDGSTWTAATVRALLWQIKGQWIFDLDKGIAYDRVLGLPADPREVQEIYRAEISKYVDLTSLTVEITQEDIEVTWAGASGEYGTISLLEPPAVDSVEPIVWGSYGPTTLAIQFSESLNTARVPEIETFEILEGLGTITAASIRGNHLFLETDQAPTQGMVLFYRPDERPMQSKARTNVDGFRLEFTNTSPTWLTTEDGDLLTTEAGDYLVTDA